MTNTTATPTPGASGPNPPDMSELTGSYTPVRIDTNKPPVDEGPRVPFFYVDDREFTIPERIPARLAFKALKVAGEQGRDAAVWFLVENALTPDAILELTEGEASRHLERGQVTAMLTELGRRYYGQAEEAWGAGK